MEFHWLVDDGPHIVALDSSSSPIMNKKQKQQQKTGRIAQSVTCLVADASLTADPGVASSIMVRSHTFLGVDYEKISTVILLPSAESLKKNCCHLQAKVCARRTG